MARVAIPSYRRHQYLYIQIGALGVAFDEAFARGYVVAHEHTKDLIGLDSLFNRNLEDGPFGRVHRSVPERGGVHLAQTFVTTNLRLLAVMGRFVLLHQRIPLLVGIDVMHLLAKLDVEQWWLRNIQM